MVIRDKPYPEYAKIEGVTATILKLVASEPLKTVKAILDGSIKRESDTLDFGKAFHSLVLEGKREFVVQPETYEAGDGKTKPWTNLSTTCKAWKAEQTLPIMDKYEVADLLGMEMACRSHEELAPYLTGEGDRELSVFVDKDGRKLKARIDLLPGHYNAPVIDFKKTRSADPAKFVRQAFDLKYHLQAAFYLDVLRMAGVDRKEFWFVAVEDRAPYNVSIVKMKDVMLSFIALGRREYRAAYQKLMEAKRSNQWPTYASCDAEEHVTSWISAAIEATA